jgi:hypothetical protein
MTFDHRRSGWAAIISAERRNRVALHDFAFSVHAIGSSGAGPACQISQPDDLPGTCATSSRELL